LGIRIPLRRRLPDPCGSFSIDYVLVALADEAAFRGGAAGCSVCDWAHGVAAVSVWASAGWAASVMVWA